MTDNFALHAGQTLDDILDRMSGHDTLSDLDFDLVDGVLTVEFDSGGTLILNRQEAARQIWLASPEGPAHFSYDAQRAAWIDARNGDELYATLSRILSTQLGASVVL
ncbi:iron donor protein CyaY [Acidihalobacter ferrooxydans]|uniref:Iron-sulfur cluster assembly protein CyaY n=1 Tax=Acidihalobacter ferrooxydans TaxID=1765967 RepID=A0A1P8UIJ6_9GAMM|nr:iron donor protein CyaY [Acidihalobacter ferrooxydans]APZ43637.1 iron donor protein CyaY [Acidihalobacter ferrooxydans]